MLGEKNTLCRLLIVDDNQDAANTLGVLLGMAGYQVKTAFNGLNALAIAASFDPEACILDINMPGMNGYELARRLRAMAKDHPLILATVTACNDDKHLDRAVLAGFSLHFTKPADADDIAEQLEKCVADSSQQGAG